MSDPKAWDELCEINLKLSRLKAAYLGERDNLLTTYRHKRDRLRAAYHEELDRLRAEREAVFPRIPEEKLSVAELRDRLRDVGYCLRIEAGLINEEDSDDE
jgi:hypothetical protein